MRACAKCVSKFGEGYVMPVTIYRNKTKLNCPCVRFLSSISGRGHDSFDGCQSVWWTFDCRPDQNRLDDDWWWRAVNWFGRWLRHAGLCRLAVRRKADAILNDLPFSDANRVVQIVIVGRRSAIDIEPPFANKGPLIEEGAVRAEEREPLVQRANVVNLRNENTDVLMELQFGHDASNGDI